MSRTLMSLFAGLAIILSIAGLACGDDEDSGDRQPSVDGQASASEDDTSSGAIVPNTFMTYDSRQYRLADVIQADLIDESEFREAGEATESDVQGDRTVYTREGDSTSVYTFADASGSGEQAVPATWYRWDPAE